MRKAISNKLFIFISIFSRSPFQISDYLNLINHVVSHPHAHSHMGVH
jgi:hypothetical protein